MTLEFAGQFVLYVLAFWGLWKVFDTTFHLFLPPNSDCKGCKKRDKEIQTLKEERDPRHRWDLANPTQLNANPYAIQLKRLKEERDRWKREALEQIALKKLNTCSPQELEQIYGCGPVSAQKLIRRRPLKNLEEANRVIPGRSVRSLLNWAERYA
jgi:hypothetical protein